MEVTAYHSVHATFVEHRLVPEGESVFDVWSAGNYGFFGEERVNQRIRLARKIKLFRQIIEGSSSKIETEIVYVVVVFMIIGLGDQQHLCPFLLF